MAEPTITDADREAAAALFRDTRTDLAVKFRLGCDPQPLLEAFARHREASTAELRAENERLREAGYIAVHELEATAPFMGEQSKGDILRAASQLRAALGGQHEA